MFRIIAWKRRKRGMWVRITGPFWATSPSPTRCQSSSWTFCRRPSPSMRRGSHVSIRTSSMCSREKRRSTTSQRSLRARSTVNLWIHHRIAVRCCLAGTRFITIINSINKCSISISCRLARYQRLRIVKWQVGRDRRERKAVASLANSHQPRSSQRSDRRALTITRNCRKKRRLSWPTEAPSWNS